MEPISVCIIAKNEEKYLDTCLSALKSFPVEIVVVDTGSTDRTVEIAKKYTQSVYFFEWCDDFSAARNYAAKMAKNNYIIALDCDEFVEKIDLKQIEALLEQYPFGFGNITLTNLVGNEERMNRYRTTPTRIYDRRFAEFRSRVHEQLCRKDGGPRAEGNINMSAVHVGYLMSEEDCRKKNERNITLLEREIADEKENSYLYFQLGQSYNALGQPEKALEAQKKALNFLTDKKAPYVQPLVFTYGDTCLQSGCYEDALIVQNYYDELCGSADYMFILGKVFYANGKIDDALLAFEAATLCENYSEEGMNTYFPLNAMALIYEKLGLPDKAKECDEKAQSFLKKAMKHL